MAHRHESLVPLSKDHYQGLLLAQQIKTADRVMMAGWPSAPAQQATFVRSFFSEHLTRHFADEEQSLFPLVREHVPSASVQVDDLLQDHRDMEKFARSFEHPDPQRLPTQIAEFGDLLERHIRKEERELFPLFEAQAPPDVLQRVGHLLHRPDSSHDKPTS
ncbi:MAG: hemerythrin domain-containing protein [Bacteroidota bacterium]